MFDTNVLGTLLGMKHELRVMQAQGSGSIVNHLLDDGRSAAPRTCRSTPPANTRSRALTKSAALEAAAFGVRVNAVAPGPTETAMLDRLTGSAPKKGGVLSLAVPLKRGGTPEEIADAIVFRRLRQGGVHHRPDHPRQRRQDRELISACLAPNQNEESHDP